MEFLISFLATILVLGYVVSRFKKTNMPKEELVRIRNIENKMLERRKNFRNY